MQRNTHILAWSLLACSIALLGGSQEAQAGETRLRLQGRWADGTRHADRLYLRQRPAAQLVAVSLRPQPDALRTPDRCTAQSDALGRGTWYRLPSPEDSPWLCLAATMDDGLQLTIWVSRTGGHVLYCGQDASGQLRLWGTGDLR